MIDENKATPEHFGSRSGREMLEAHGDRIRNYVPISSKLVTAGIVPVDLLERAAPYLDVVDLLPPEHGMAVPDEGRRVSSAGGRYVSIPVAFEEPTETEFIEFLGALARCLGGERAALVHCAINYRVSRFVEAAIPVLAELELHECSPEVSAQISVAKQVSDESLREYLRDDPRKYEQQANIWAEFSGRVSLLRKRCVEGLRRACAISGWDGLEHSALLRLVDGIG